MQHCTKASFRTLNYFQGLYISCLLDLAVDLFWQYGAIDLLQRLQFMWHDA
jgi:hypothetical protein